MRDIGYSLETAIADLVDNSISAGARQIDIVCDMGVTEPRVHIIDDGLGMCEEGLLEAMRHGTDSARKQRTRDDLGRFGLGLKTASFSQCRCLTVLSRKEGHAMCAAEWDLDLIDHEDEWILRILDDTEMRDLGCIDELPSHGTIIIWRSLDRLLEGETGDRGRDIVNEKLRNVERHLALVFHRFLAGEVKPRKLSITLNGHPVQPFDPFCRKNKATQERHEEVIRLGDSEIRIQAYVLPHHSNLSREEHAYYQERSDFFSNQGAYVYRNYRLMVWGDWFRIIPKGEATKLARIRIDFPNSLDEAWTIDIKKARATPPPTVRERLKRIIDEIAARSATVHRTRGKRLIDTSCTPLWERHQDRTHIRYELNRGHPLITHLSSVLPDTQKKQLSLILDAISASLPVDTIYADASISPQEIHQTSSATSDAELTARLKSLWTIFHGETRPDREVLMGLARDSHLFDDQLHRVEKLLEKI